MSKCTPKLQGLFAVNKLQLFPLNKENLTLNQHKHIQPELIKHPIKFHLDQLNSVQETALH